MFSATLDIHPGDKDARDIVKYIESGCDVLAKPEYGLIAPGLGKAAAAFSKSSDNDVEAKKKLLLKEIKDCYSKLRAPLTSALLKSRVVPQVQQD